MKSFRIFFLESPWWGKLLGAFFGYLAARSVGALVGILLGNFFDRGLTTHFSREHWDYFSEKRKEVQTKFFSATFTVMGHIAKADGRVSEQEIQMTKTLMKEMQLNRQQTTQAQQFFNTGKDQRINIQPIITDLRQACRNNPALLKLFLDIQYRAALVDGLTQKKIKALDQIFTWLGFAPLHKQYRFYTDFHFNDQGEQYSSSSHQRTSKTASSSTIDQAYALLELTPAATHQEVKKTYRRLISRNHPDKLISQGLPESMIKMANEKTQKIRKAYEHICENKGWNY